MAAHLATITRRATARRRPLLAAAMATITLAATSSVAHAADRYATPAGSLEVGAACSQINPCGLGRAVIGAGANDTIHIGPGSYGTADAPLTYGIGKNAPGLTYIGDRRATLYIDNSDPDSFDLFDKQVLRGNGMRIVSKDSVGLKLVDEAFAERVDVRTAGGTGCQLRSSTAAPSNGGAVYDSLCLSSASVGIGLSAFTNGAGPQSFQVVGSTLIGSGQNGRGLVVDGTGNTGGASIPVIEVVLSIINGTQLSIVAAGGPSSPAYVDLVSTAYTSVNTLNATLRETSGTARVVDPGFVTPGTDFHLRDDSPLVNALGISAVGPTTTDLDGALRDPKLPEPGAYEARSRTITLEAPRVVDATTAQLPTSIRAGLAGTVWWEATPAAGGTPIRFGDTSVAAAVAPTTPTATVSTLRPSTEYVVRGYLEDEVGRVTSNEVRLITPAAPPSAGGTPTPTPTPAIGSPTSTPTSCTVPRLIGRTLPRARTLLKAAGCKLGAIKGRQRKRATIRTQSPSAGANRAAGFAVKVTLRGQAKKR